MKQQTSRYLFRAGLAGRIAVLLIGASFALMVVGLAQASSTQASTSSTNADQDFAAIDEYVQKQMEEARLPGVALGIVKGDEIVHLKGFGEADDSGRKVTARTPFIIGSNAKSFTALAIMQLVEEGKVELDAPVQRYIPWFRVADPEASRRITVRHLLNQTSGLPATADAYLLKGEDGSAGALEKGVRSLSTAELAAPVGESFAYCNMNYATLGLIVQTVSGTPYEQYVEEHILAPLKMDNSFMSPWEAERHGLATGHEYWFGRPFSGGGMPYNRASTPSGLIVSDAEDMSHYLIAQLNGGRYGEARILSPEGIAELHRGDTEPVKLGDVTASYGMGWADIEAAGGTRIVAHNGDTGDFHAKMLLAPESGWGVVVLMNGSNSLREGGMDETANVVMARLVGIEPIPVTTTFQEPNMLQLLLILAVSALQVAGIVRSVVLLRRWRAHPERRPRGVLRTGLRLGVPVALNLAWPWAILYLTAGFSTDSLVLLMSTDIGWAALVSGAVALGWGVILKPVLAFFALRKRDTPGDTGAPPRESEVPVKA